MTTTSNEAPKPFIARTKHYMKKYGYVGIGVYCILGAIDLSAIMAVISVKGAERVRDAEDYAISKAKGWLGIKHTPRTPNSIHERPSFTSLFVIAYGIHKTILLPFRLSLTAAITPTVARRLKELGWIRTKIPKDRKK
ncbi:hypothetical protein A0J61_01320 [Choanephora cucurbitarum]|uniref:DUF1279 domain-containing protein n=1 Tax=Choanephora cucurbitarum TaxID=101091 RepID=A0A1C7NSZ0_9FUNG|nr:hypothetical protein A0J61_01320 [Choanephora cucurbitarum]